MTDSPGRGASSRTARASVFAALTLAGIGGGFLVLATIGLPVARGQPSETPADVRPNPGSPPGPAVYALAYLEPASGLITVGVRPGARIIDLPAKTDDEVKEGDLLAILEGHDQATKQLALATAQKADADRRRTLQRDRLSLERSQYDQLKTSRLEAAQHVAQATQARLKEVKDASSKFGTLLNTDGKLKFEIEHASFDLETASIKADLDLKQLEAEQGSLVKHRALEDRAVDEESPSDDLLARQIDVARAAVAQTEVRAPAAGTVLERIADPGEVSAGPLLTLGDLTAMVARAEVYQTDVPRVEIGDPAEVQILGRSVRGKVTKIARTIAANSLRSLDPRAPQDLRVVAVTIALDDPAVASRFVNMQVDAIIRAKKPTQP